MNDLEEFIETTRNILDRINQDTDCGFTQCKDVKETKQSTTQKQLSFPPISVQYHLGCIIQ